MWKILRSQKGSAAILFALAITVLAGFSALVIDVGLFYLNKEQLSNMADAAALAGARQLLSDATGSPTTTAQQIASLNGEKQGDTVTVTVSNNVVTVTVTRKVSFLFAPILGITSSNITVSAGATAGVLASATGVMPFGVQQETFTYGVDYTLKAGGGGGTTGNFGGLALGGNGASVYQANIENGYSGTLHIGDKVSTEPGNMSGPTSTGVNYRIAQDPTATFPPSNSSPRVVTIPIVDSMDVNGKKQVTIVGFAAFFLEGVGGSGNKNYVTGRFMKMVEPGDLSTSGTFFGLYNVKLIE